MLKTHYLKDSVGVNTRWIKKDKLLSNHLQITLVPKCHHLLERLG